MKRVAALAMAAMLLLSFAACTRNNGNNNASPDDLPGASTNVPATNVPAPGTQKPTNTAGTEEQNTSPETIWNAIFEKYGDTFPVTEAIPAESLKEVTGIDPEKLESFVFQYPLMNVSASEFLIAECKEGELEAVKEEVMAHQANLVEQWEKYLPEQLKLVENYVMETAGNYVFFAVAKNAEGAADIFKSFFA